MPLKIGAVGTFIRDTIVTLEDRRFESIGGLYHTLAYLASLGSAETVLAPLCHLGEDFYTTVAGALRALSARVGFDLVYPHAQRNTAVTLIYRSRENRDEVTSAPMPPITPAQMRGLCGADAVLINLITGQDVELEAVHHFKQQSPATLVYLDLHSFALGIAADGRRYYRQPASWQNLLAAVDVVQLNEQEAATIAGWQTKPQDGEFLALGEGLAQELVRACHITLGSRGSLLFYRKGGTVFHEYLPPLVHLQVVDIIGCGDAFGAAFLTRFLSTEDYVEATRFANRVAGLNCTFMGSLTPEKFQTHVAPYL